MAFVRPMPQPFPIQRTKPPISSNTTRHIFFAALLNNQPMGFYPPNTLCLEARNRGVTLLPVDINLSEIDFTAAEDSIRIGLKQVNSLSSATQAAIIKARAQGPFTDVEQFCRRVPLQRDELRQLILCGPLTVSMAIGASCSGGWRICGRTSTPVANIPLPISLRALPASQPLSIGSGTLPSREKFLAEYRVLGLHPTRHPMELVREVTSLPATQTSRELKQLPPGQTVTAAGIVIRPPSSPDKEWKNRGLSHLGGRIQAHRCHYF